MNENLNRAKMFDDDDQLEIKDVDIEQVEDLNVEQAQEAAESDQEAAEYSEEELKEDIEKKSDNEIINDYLKPNQRCVLCTTPMWSLKLNKAYLDGKTYAQMITEFSDKFEERTSRSLNKSLLHRHFKSHFDARAAAIAEYNKRQIANPNTISPSGNQRDLFQLATQKFLDELEIFDATAKELITKYKELESLIDDKRAAGKTFGIDELIMKQAQILNALNKQAISKFKALSKVDLENKQGQFLSQLSFIGNKAVGGLSQVNNKQRIPADELEKIYLSIVIKQILARLEDPLKRTFGLMPVDQKTLFYRELKKSIEGIQDAISIDFNKQIKSENQRLIEDKNSQNSLVNT